MFEQALQDHIYQPGVILPIIFGVLGLLSIAFAISMAVPSVVKRLIPAPKATRLGDHIKFKKMAKDKKTIVDADGLQTIILSVKGTDLKFNDISQQQILAQARQIWIEQIIELGVRARIFMIRDKLPKAGSYKHTHGVMEKVSETWARELPLALSTEYYIVLSHPMKGKGATILDEAVEQTKNILDAYTVTELVDELEVAEAVEDGVDLNEIRYDKMTPAGFFGRILAPVSRPIPFTKHLKSDLSYAMTTDNMRYDSDIGMFEFSHGSEKKYAATLVIEEWPTPMTEMFMLEMMSNPIEMTICHDVKPIGKAAAMATLAWQQKLAPGLQPGSDSLEQYETVALALEPGSEEEQALATVQTMITVYGNTPEEVIKGRNVINQMKSVGINAIWPKHTMVQHWFGHFPGFDAQSRPQRILSGEISLLCTFQHNPSGELNSDWGQGPIAMFETIDGAPYSFQFHTGGGSPPLGHCVSIGPSGSGKTTLITFLASMALRHHDLKTFFFDRGRGCEVITKSLGGSYLFFDGDEKNNVALNPLQIDDTPENRLFMREWLKMIGDVKAEDHDYSSQIADAVDLIFDPSVERKFRNLGKLYNTMFPAGSELRNRFLAWTNTNEYGAIVCAENDALDISQRVGGFDFTNILDDPKLGPAMVSYLMHRILVEAKGDPRLIFIDETEPLLRNEGFQMRFRKLLQEGRKERQVIISCFQRPGAPESLGLGDVIRGQCPTVFFFRNPAAEEGDYADWQLTRRELDFVMGRSYRKKRYAVLLKRYTETGESVILNTDLSNLGPYMNIYHSGRTQVQKMERMEQEFGSKALEHYLAAS